MAIFSLTILNISQDIETAKNVRMRRDDKLIIDAKIGWKDGVKFYFGNEKGWLADNIPNRYIRSM